MSAAASQYSFHADRFGSEIFASLWVEAWGDQYPVDVAPFSSCTVQLLHQLDGALGLKTGEVLVDLGCGTGGVGLWLAQKQQTKEARDGIPKMIDNRPWYLIKATSNG